MKRLNLTIIATFICVGLHAFPCKKYVFDFESKTMPGKLRISWSINTGVNRCAFGPEEIFKNRFIVSFENLFGDALQSDTIDLNYFIVDTNLAGGEPTTFNIVEVENPDNSEWFTIKPNQEEMPHLFSQTDSLNFYLLNGYFFNAMTIIGRLGKADLINEIKKEYKILFPENYPGEQTYFNSYVDSASMRLVKMPTVDGLSSFIESINGFTKNGIKRSTGFKVFAKISGDGGLTGYQVIPASDKELFEKAMHQLKFDNHTNQSNELVIIIGRSKNRKAFTLANERALMDQRSPAFRTKFPFRGGAIH